MPRSAICMRSAAPSTTKPRRNFPASRWPPAATSISPSSATRSLLCEHVDAFGLAARAKEAVARRVHEMSFGTRADCEGYMQRVQKAQAAVANQKQITGALKAKLDRLARQLRIPQQRRHRTDGRLAGVATADRARQDAQTPLGGLERARRGLLGPLYPAAALSAAGPGRLRGRVRVRTPRLGRAGLDAPSPRQDLPRSAGFVEQDPGRGIVLDLLQRFAGLTSCAARQAFSRASRSLSWRLRSASRVFKIERQRLLAARSRRARRYPRANN